MEEGTKLYELEEVEGLFKTWRKQKRAPLQSDPHRAVESSNLPDERILNLYDSEQSTIGFQRVQETDSK